jgi:molybdopterin converting factor small subunit
MTATLHLPTVLSRLADGQRAIPVAPGTVREVIARVAGQFPALAPRIRDEKGEPHPFLNVFLNDEDIRFTGGLDAPVKDGDDITLVPAIAGG